MSDGLSVGGGKKKTLHGAECLSFLVSGEP